MALLDLKLDTVGLSKINVTYESLINLIAGGKFRKIALGPGVRAGCALGQRFGVVQLAALPSRGGILPD
jgi:hypothetical protein